jgi:Fe-S oxidoreductase
VSSPHCYHTYTREYPEFMVHFEVVHMSQLIHSLIAAGRLQLKTEYAKTVTYHDPCYLGRHNGVYDAPRDALQSVPGLKLKELPESRKNSFCCGGGGGRIWMETPKGERFSDLRLAQAIGTGAEVLATSCPYCITNFEDSRLNVTGGDAIEVKDITEVIRDAL